MTTVKQIGIWMDHSSAHLIEFTGGPMTTTIIESTFTHDQKEESLSKSENLMHNKEQHKHAEYYKKIGETIKHYNEILLFGPTDAKLELCNLLKADHQFANIKIETKSADKMSEHQQQAFVKEHFAK